MATFIFYFNVALVRHVSYERAQEEYIAYTSKHLPVFTVARITWGEFYNFHSNFNGKKNSPLSSYSQ